MKSFHIELSGKIKHESQKEKTLSCKTPAFALHEPPIKEIEKYSKKFNKLKNLLVIGNGGSISSFNAIYGALKHKSKKNAQILNSMEPFAVLKAKKENPKSHTLVMPVSKSGNNIDMLEPLMQFIDYKMLAVTSNKNSPLKQIIEIKKIPFIEHPNIAGRFSGMTASGLAPAGICKLPIKKIFSGAKKCYNECSPSVPIKENPAKKLALHFFELEKKGFIEIFMPIYSLQLSHMLPLAGQLVHETLGKKGKGLSLFGGIAPEAQHHSLQRVLGGKKNISVLFLRSEKPEKELKLKIPRELQRVKLHNSFLKTFQGQPYSKGLQFDFLGVKETIKRKRIPHAEISLQKVLPETIGGLIALLQYFAFYSALLRKVNPFNQPNVEKSKKKSIELRRKFAVRGKK